ncbi:hypothetical protein K443DRAFT_121100 [Laccaria amethystina LaAM-08-1]|uniref:Uncharacterized protein n=1 Tax=Laccaria amethystina LaAM-08-1 TaxID=1095629 RepID=A0A0C9XGT5_9AGAR|nr:hypothetical protein K443DRAFT_121100 [Laccaria amethystina LaAM-08-1]
MKLMVERGYQNHLGDGWKQGASLQLLSSDSSRKFLGTSGPLNLQSSLRPNPRIPRRPVATSYLTLQPFLSQNPTKSRSDYDAEIARIATFGGVGGVHILGEAFLDLMGPVPVINLHPALPGAFDGANA